MARIEKTVFISYRRTNAPWALAIYQNLTQHGYNVFYDFKGIASGDFERVILENIKARAHFLVLLTPSALDRCGEPGDWLLREIETAMESQRNIIPLTLENFDFGSPGIAKHLTGELATLKRYNALRVPADYFDDAMRRLREQFLNVPLNAVLHPASSTAQQAAKAQQLAASSAPEVQKTALTAQEWFEKGFNATDPHEKLRCYSEAIRLDPDYAPGDLDGALKDLDKAIRLKPDYAPAWGFVRRRWGAEVEEFPSALEQPSRHDDHKRGWSGTSIAIVLAVIILAGTVLYSQQSGSLAALGVNINGLVRRPWKSPPQSQAHDNTTQGEVAQSESSGSIEVQSPKSETPPASADPNLQTDAKATPKERTYRVSDAFFVRDKPRSDANITGMLEPGTRIKVAE
jgi:hypothetical protein